MQRHSTNLISNRQIGAVFQQKRNDILVVVLRGVEKRRTAKRVLLVDVRAMLNQNLTDLIVPIDGALMTYQTKESQSQCLTKKIESDTQCKGIRSSFSVRLTWISG
jgi:hypothetical protein